MTTTAHLVLILGALAPSSALRLPMPAFLETPQVFAKPALGALLAAAITFSPIDPAEAARSGGRVGGRVSSTRRAPAPSQARRPVTNVYVAPTMGYGYGMGYGGYGMGGGGTGLYLGLSLAEAFLREQQRQAYLERQLQMQRELGQDQAMIQSLTRELEAQRAKVDGLRAQQEGSGAPAPQVAAPADSETVRLLQQQLLEQQKEIEALRVQGK